MGIGEKYDFLIDEYIKRYHLSKNKNQCETLFSPDDSKCITMILKTFDN